MEIRKQRNRLVKIANGILGYELTGKKADFFNFRYSGASHMAMRGRSDDGRYVAGTVNGHYFNIDDEMLEVVEAWGVAELSAITPRSSV